MCTCLFSHAHPPAAPTAPMCCALEIRSRGPTSIYAGPSRGTGHHRRRRAGLSLSAPVQSTSKQKDSHVSTTEAPSGRSPTLPTPHLTLSSVPLRGGGPQRVPCMGKCSRPGGCLWGRAPSHQEVAMAGLCLPATPWSPVSKKQKQDLVPEPPGSSQGAPSPWNRLALPGRGQHRAPPKTAPKSSLRPERPATGHWRSRVGLPSAHQEGGSRGSPKCDLVGHRSQGPSRPDWGSGLNPFLAQSPRAPHAPARRGGLPGATGARPPGAGRPGRPGRGARGGPRPPGRPPRSGGGHSPSGWTVFSGSSG